MKKFGRAEIGQIAGMFRRGGTCFYFKSQLGKSRHLHVPLHRPSVVMLLTLLRISPEAKKMYV